MLCISKKFEISFLPGIQIDFLRRKYPFSCGSIETEGIRIFVRVLYNFLLTFSKSNEKNVPGLNGLNFHHFKFFPNKVTDKLYLSIKFMKKVKTTASPSRHCTPEINRN